MWPDKRCIEWDDHASNAPVDAAQDPTLLAVHQNPQVLSVRLFPSHTDVSLYCTLVIWSQVQDFVLVFVKLHTTILASPFFRTAQVHLFLSWFSLLTRPSHHPD